MARRGTGAHGEVVVEDLLQGLNEWRNIQDIVRLTFKAFHDVLKAQGEALKTLERAVDSKASKAEVAAALHAKAATADVHERIKALSDAVARKADAEELEPLAAAADVQAALRQHASALAEELERKAGTADLALAREQQERALSALRADLAKKAGADDVASRLKRKADREEGATKAELAAVEEKLGAKASLEDLKAGLAQAQRKDLEPKLKALQKECSALAEELRREIGAVRDAKADRREVDDARAEMRDAAAAAGKDARAEAAKARADAEDAVRAARDSTSRSEEQVTQALAQVEQLHGAHEGLLDVLGRKADAAELADVRRILEQKAEVGQVNVALGHKASQVALNGAIERIDELRGSAVSKSDLEGKVDVKDMCTLLDTKAGVDEVNTALSDVSRELDAKASTDELSRIVREQAVINTSLCAEFSVGRWIWKSGKTKAHGGVPWNVQSVNTDPENFVWEKDKVSIITVAPGLYEVNFGFFTRRKPSVQLMVNGEPVLAAMNSASYVVHHSSGRLTTVARHPAGNVTGLTLVDFLALPPNARVAVTYSGEDNGEGFLGLKKL